MVPKDRQAVMKALVPSIGRAPQTLLGVGALRAMLFAEHAVGSGHVPGGSVRIAVAGLRGRGDGDGVEIALSSTVEGVRK